MSETTVKRTELPKLAPPGAGLPLPELWLARLLVGWQARRASRDQSAALFRDEREKILTVVATMSPEEAGTPVLIRRLRGMEDSSRGWSVWMTLDHLRIVNAGTTGLIRLLAEGTTPSRMTGTADVKPSPTADGSVVEAFRRGCEHFESSVASIDNLETSACGPHPWFGPMNAARWHFFTAFHMRLHRRQIESIRSGLKTRC